MFISDGELYLSVNYCVTKATEPGYYEDGEFGVRIENVVLIKQAETKYSPKGTPFLTMEPVTLVTAVGSCDLHATIFFSGTNTTEDDNV